jgi:hypothetical protein
VGVVVTFLLLLIFSYNVIFLFAGTASLGLFLSSTFPSMLAYTEDILQYKGEWRAPWVGATSFPAPRISGAFQAQLPCSGNKWMLPRLG